MFRLLADLNDIRDGVVTGLAEDAEGPRKLRKGDSVLVHDDGEHEVWGTVTRVKGGLVSVELNWATWDTATLVDQSFVLIEDDASGSNEAPDLSPTGPRMAVA